MKVHIEYPCGYKIKYKTSFWDWGFYKWEIDKCPIHKHDCYASILDQKISDISKKLRRKK